MLISTGSATFCNGTITSDLYFRDTFNGIATRNGDCYNITTDGGFNWTLINRWNTAGAKIAMGNENVGWLSMVSDTIIKTNNFFQTYGLQTVPNSGRVIFAVDTNIVYGATNETRVIKTTNGGGDILSVNIIHRSARQILFIPELPKSIQSNNKH